MQAKAKAKTKTEEAIAKNNQKSVRAKTCKGNTSVRVKDKNISVSDKQRTNTSETAIKDKKHQS